MPRTGRRPPARPSGPSLNGIGSRLTLPPAPADAPGVINALPTMSPPAVSLVIPTCGRRPLLEQTLASVRRQTSPDWEAIVVDDASPDDTAAWLAGQALLDARVRPLPAAGTGANAARNQGLAAARGRYVVFLDSDDLLEPDCLRLRIATLDARPHVDGLVNAMRCFRERPGDTDLAWNTLTDEDDLDRFLRMDGPWQTTGATWRRSALDRAGLTWDPVVLSLQDLDFHARALVAGLRVAKVNAWDCQYRLPFHRDAITAKVRRPEHVRSHVRVVHHLLDMPDGVRDATPDRRELLGGLAFTIATRSAAAGDVGPAQRLWAHAFNRRVIGPKRFAVGTLAIASHAHRAVGPRVTWRLCHRWPDVYQGRCRRTLFNTPLPPPASAAAPALTPRPCRAA